MKINELVNVDGEIKAVTREMTAEEIAALPVLEETPEPTDALKDMIVAMSTATTVAQMRSAAKSFLDKTEG